MRGKFPANFGAITAGALFALLVAGASFPMRLVLDGAGAAEAGFSARSVSGSIWQGRLEDAQIGALPLGDMTASVAPLSLLTGDMAVHFRRADPAQAPLEGRLYGGGARGFADVTGDVQLAQRLGPVSLSRVQLSEASLRFDSQGRCVEAGGTAQIGLSSPVAGLSLSQGLTGPISCAGQFAQIALASQSGMEKLTIRFAANGAWRARFAVAGVTDPALQAGLMAMGFRAVGDGYALAVSGT